MPHIIGLIGSFLVIFAYYRMAMGKTPGESISYYAINLVAATLLGYSLFFNFNLGSFTIEVFWVIISIIGLRRLGAFNKLLTKETSRDTH